MALGKKKQDEPVLAPEPAGPAAPAPAGDPLKPQAEAADDPLASATPPDDAEPGTATPAGHNSDALLAMFQSDDSRASDYETLLALTPEVDLDDLLEDLRTTAAALGCKAEEEDYAA
ncbi:MAG TPA: hypothetical protein VNM91_06015 [Dehalococcoidia bacterium]|nr:hypothetical protein [Dehalococcoidia bacterium]